MKEYISSSTIESNLANLRQVVFEVTNACNLKCKYCAFGELYESCEDRGHKYLSIDKAKLLLDYLCHYWNSDNNTSPGSYTYVSFYGGEPLLNIRFIKEVVDYVKKELKCSCKKFIFSMTTNAVLLDKYMDFLVENDFDLLISLDGNKKNNGYRVYHSGKASFDTIFQNINELKEKYPEYFAKHINFNSVFHNLSTVKEVLDFFNENYKKVPSISEVTNLGVRPDKKADYFNIYNNMADNLHKEKQTKKIEEKWSYYLIDYKDATFFARQYSDIEPRFKEKESKFADLNINYEILGKWFTDYMELYMTNGHHLLRIF